MMHFTDIKQIIRSLLRRKLLTSISILGLGIGLGSVILLTTYLIHEFSFDRFHSKSDRIYRVIENNNCGTYYAMGEAFTSGIPEIDKVCRITNVSDVYTVILNRNNQSYPIEKFVAADPSIFEMLDIEMMQKTTGSIATAEKGIFISSRMAKKFFNNSNAVGESIELYIANNKQVLQVAGIYRDLPSYSSLQADFICDISVAMAQFNDLEYTLGLRTERRVFDFKNEWTHNNNFTTFVLLNTNAAVTNVEQKCTDIYKQHRPDLERTVHLQPYSEMYLHSIGLENLGALKVSKFESLRNFLSIGILILLVACLNYILISSSELEQSFKELACRKVNGASGSQIVIIVLLKSFIVTLVSLVPAFIFVRLSMPLFNNFFEKEIDLSLFLDWKYLSALLAITLVTALLAGLYLSIVALKANPIRLLQKKNPSSFNTQHLNKALLVVQFVVFIVLLSCTLIMKKNLNFSLKTDMGIDTKNIMVVDLGTENIKRQYKAIISEVQKIPHVLACEPTTYFLPPNENILFASFMDESTGQGMQQEVIFLAAGNTQFVNIPLIDGVEFSEATAANRDNILINEAAAKKFEVKAGDKVFHFNVLGVLKNFLNKSIHESIRPLFVIPQTSGFTNLAIKTDGANAEVADQIRTIFQEMEPGYYFESELLTDRIDRFYKADRQQTQIISFFSIIALTLSFMGLFGFVSLSLTAKIKEIGIRKINGAKASEIMLMLNKHFTVWVIIAFTIATPIAWYIMNLWLQNFAYKTPLSWWVFALAGIIAFGIAVLTVSWQTFKAARRNPVEALRYE